MSNRGSKKKENHQNLTLKMMITSNQVQLWRYSYTRALFLPLSFFAVSTPRLLGCTIRETENVFLLITIVCVTVTAALSTGSRGIFLILKQLADMLFLGCFYTIVTAVHHTRDWKGSLVDHYVCVSVTTAHLSCHWSRWNHIEPLLIDKSP